MEVAHEDKTENNGDDTKKLDFVVTLDAAGEVVGYDAVKFDD